MLPLLTWADEQKELLVENLTGYPVEVLYRADDKTDTDTDCQTGCTKHATIETGEFMKQPVTPNFTFYFKVQGNEIIGQYTTNANANQRVILDQDALDDAGIPAAPQPTQDTVGTKGSALPPPLPTPTFAKPSSEPGALPPKFESRVEKAPERGALVNWYDGPPEAMAITTHKQKFVNVGEHGAVGQVVSAKDNEAKTTAAFMLREVTGKRDTYRLQNTYYLDSYLYIDANVGENAPIRSGPEGKTLATGEWLVKKGQNFYKLVNAAKPSLRIGTHEDAVVTSSKAYDTIEAVAPRMANSNLTDAEKATFIANYADQAAYNAGDAFLLYDVKSYRALLGMAPALAASIEAGVNALKAHEAAVEKANREKANAEKEEIARNAERRRIAAIPETNHPFGHDDISVRLGVGDVFQTKDGGHKAIKYTFAPPNTQPNLTANLHTSDNPKENQFMDLNINPEIAAWVKDGELYIAIDTGKETSLSLRHGENPSSGKPTDSNFYVGHVRMNVQLGEGKEVIMYPGTEIKAVNAGSSADVSKGINFSAEEIMGADISESKGINFGFEAREYEVSGGRGPGDPDFGSVQYEWDSCGLADKPKTTENCTYETPVDLFDKETLTLRKIPKIAQSLSGLQTRTVFKVRITKEGLSNRQLMHFDVHVQLHMVKLLPSTKENTKNKDWEDFKAGFTYVFRPDLWDFNKSFEDQHIIKEALYKPVGFTLDKTFRIWLWLHIEDLKPYMKD